MPKVSICLPNLNNQPFLRERFDTILNQTLGDWELIVVDNYSEDGAWELIRQVASSDARLRVSQAPREGMYANWNNCVQQARGEYVYIATSDDTMMPDCLEKMVSALDKHPECGLCQCGLAVIDEKSRAHSSLRWKDFAFGRFAPEWLKAKHIRRAPLDGLLHYALQCIYTSITQLLVRRRVFDRVGLFESSWGSMGDFEWGMRVGLLEDCLFLPEELATWRVHPKQATCATESSANRRKLLAMSKAAFSRATGISGSLFARLEIGLFEQFYGQQIFDFERRETRTTKGRLKYLVGESIHGNACAIKHIRNRLRGRSYDETAQFRTLRLLLEQNHVPAPTFL